MNAKLKCSARIIGTPHGITLSKPEHCHDSMDFPEPKHRRSKNEKFSEIYTEYVAHE
jgi:hypothetical protein